MEATSESAPTNLAEPGHDWVTREDAAKIICKVARTVDRLVSEGLLKTLPREPGMRFVRITRASIEAYTGKKIDPAPARPMMTIEVDYYEGLRNQLTRKDAQINEMSSKLIVWEGEKQAHKEELEKVKNETAELAIKFADTEAGKVQVEADLEKARVEAEDLAAKYAEAEVARLKVEDELSAERSKGFWARVLNRPAKSVGEGEQGRAHAEGPVSEGEN